MGGMKRIIDHPILPPLSRRLTTIPFTFEGETLEGIDGEPVAAALAAAGIKDFHYSHTYREARGLFCGIGQCQECVMVIDGVPNIRTCITPLRKGMVIRRQIGRGDIRDE